MPQRNDNLPVFDSSTGEVIFTTVALDLGLLPPWRGLAGSLAVHAVLVPALGLLISLPPQEADSFVAARVTEYQSLRIEVPSRRYLAAGQPAPAPVSRRASSAPGSEGAGRQTPAPAPASQSSPAGQSTAGSPPAPAPAETAQTPKPPRRMYELPPATKIARGEQTILQPMDPIDMPVKIRADLPTVIFWSSLPKAPRRKAVLPGDPSPVPQNQPVRLDAPPAFDPPNRETALADMKSSAGAVLENPKFPRRAANIAPLRVPTPGETAPHVLLEPMPGDALQLAIISNKSVPLSDSLIVPRGNQIGASAPVPSDGNGSGAGGGAGSGKNAGTGASTVASAAGTGRLGGTGFGSGSGSGTGSGASTGNGVGGNSGKGNGSGSGPGSGAEAGAGGGAGAGTGVGFASGPGTGTGPGLVAGSGSGGNSGNGNGAGGGSGTASAFGNLLAGAMPVRRTVHPTTGTHDVVVVQTTMNELFQESVGVLSGKPVYTVYLKLGGPKDWVMQYCVPGAGKQPAKQSMVVTLSVPAPLKAPYPRVTVVPELDLLQSSRYTFVHALLDTAGKFSSLRLLGSIDRSIEQALYELLSQWEFRPATRDGAPVAVEVVLAIPPSKA